MIENPIQFWESYEKTFAITLTAIHEYLLQSMKAIGQKEIPYILVVV